MKIDQHSIDYWKAIGRNDNRFLKSVIVDIRASLGVEPSYSMHVRQLHKAIGFLREARREVRILKVGGA